MIADKSLFGSVSHILKRYIISASVTAGAPLIREGTVTAGGDAKLATTTSLTKCLGLAGNTVVYSTTQADMYAVDAGLGRTDLLGRSVPVIINPFHVLKARIAGGATVGTALANVDPATILLNSTADTTGLIVSDTQVGTLNQRGGILIGRTGANAGFRRRITTHNNSADERCVVPFPYTIAAADTFWRLPFSDAAETVQLTSDFTEVDGSIIFATGGAASVLRVRIPESASNGLSDQLFLEFVPSDRHFS